MAEILQTIMGKDITSVTFKDADSPANTYTFQLKDGELTIIDGAYEEMMQLGPDGLPIATMGPRRAGVRSYCGLIINGYIRDVGKNTSDATYPDLIRNEGVVSSTPWVSTTSSPDGDMHTWDVEVVVANRVVGATTTYGGTYHFDDVRLQGNFQFPISTTTGALVNGHEWRSVTTPKYVFTRAS